MSAKYGVFFAYGLLVAYVSLRQVDPGVIGSYDKLGHLIVYGVFAVLAYPLRGGPKSYVGLCVGLLIYSGLLEIGQSFIPGRDMSLYDLLANGAGLVLGAMAVQIWCARQRAQNRASD